MYLGDTILVQYVLYAAECWALRSSDRSSLERTDKAMIRWICGLKAKYIFSTASLYEKLGIQDVSTLPSQHRIRWAGHVHRSTSWTSQGQTIVVEDSIDKRASQKDLEQFHKRRSDCMESINGHGCSLLLTAMLGGRE